MDFLILISEYGVMLYALLIFFGGRWGVKFFALFPRKVHNFLLFASIFALIFILMEMVAGTFKESDAIKYLLTYAVVTSCYENLVSIFPFLQRKKK